MNKNLDIIVHLFQKKKFKEALSLSKTFNEFNNPFFLNLLGLIYIELNDIPNSIDCLRKAILYKRNYYEAYVNLGIVLKKDDQEENAIKILQGALLIKNDYPPIYENLARTFHKLKNYTEAEKNYKLYLKFNPNDKKITCLLAELYFDTKKHLQALKLFKSYMKSYGEDADILNLIGNFLSKCHNKLNWAKKCFLKAIKVNNKNFDAFHNLGYLFLKKYDFIKAEKYIKKSIKLNLKYSNESKIFTDAYNTLGMLYYKQGKFNLAKKFYLKSLKQNNSNLKTKFNLGLLHVRLGNYKEGWLLREEYRENEYLNNTSNKNKRWSGQKVNGILYILREQGIGDEILFLQTIGSIKNKAKKIIIQLDRRLHSLAERFFKISKYKNVYIEKEIDTSIEKNEDFISNSSFFTHIGSTHQYIINSKKDFNKLHFPYLLPDKNKINYFNKFINKNKINIGICWESTNKFEISRKIQIEKIAKLFHKNNFKLFNLQYGNQDIVKQKSISNNLEYFNDIDYNKDFDNLAALIFNLDYVITVQNTIAHLSCALNKKTIVFLTKDCRFNWGFKGYKSLFYPSAMVLRQKKIGSWKYEYNKLYQLIKKKEGLKPSFLKT